MAAEGLRRAVSSRVEGSASFSARVPVYGFMSALSPRPGFDPIGRPVSTGFRPTLA